MISPELQPRSFRPYIASSLSAPSLSSNDNGSSYSPDRAVSVTAGASPDSHFPIPSSSASRSRFSPSSFSHNGRIAVALVPCAAFLLDLGGAPVVATLTLGLMLSYILDSLNLKSGAFFGNANQLHSIRVVNGAVALVVVIIALEVRVVFHSFGRYIQVPPPLNYLLVTTTMLGGAAGAGAYALGMVSDAFSSLVFTALAVIVSAAGALVVGFPILVCFLFPILHFLKGGGGAKALLISNLIIFYWRLPIAFYTVERKYHIHC
ncbi:hypothetical protein LINPERHAP1_LOCUS42723 [Linum perenne]